MTSHLHLAAGNGCGDTTFEGWYRTHHVRLRAMCDRMLRDRALAEDVVQETLLRAWAHRSQFAEGADVGPWLRTVARNLCVEAIRVRSRAVPTGDGLDEHPDVDADPSFPLERAEEHRAVRDAMKTLSARHRAMLFAHDVQGIEYSEIATREGLTENATRAVLFRARRVLRDRVEAATKAVGGMVVAVRIKLRNTSSRAASLSLQPVAASIGSSVVGAALAIASVVSGANVPAATAVLAARQVASGAAIAPAGAVAAPLAVQGDAGSQTPARTSVAGVATSVDRRKGDVKTRATIHNPVSGGDEYVWTRAWREHGGGDSVVLSTADNAAAVACEQNPDACDQTDQILKG